MEHTDAGVHTVLADVERPAEHDPFADQPDRVLTERPIETTAEVVASPPAARIAAGPAPAGPASLGLAGAVASGRSDGSNDLGDSEGSDGFGSSGSFAAFGGSGGSGGSGEVVTAAGSGVGDPTAAGTAGGGHVPEALDEDLEDDLDDDLGEVASDGGADRPGDGQTLAPVIDLGLGDLLGEAMEWQERALCAQTDPEAFFPEKGGSTREAKRICSGCEVRAECLEYALENDERFGIWGGMSERERRKQRRRAV